MPLLVWGGMALAGAWGVSEVAKNATQSIDNVADTSNKAAQAALIGLLAFVVYKKVVK